MEIKLNWNDFQEQLKSHIQEGESILEGLKDTGGLGRFKETLKRCDDWGNEGFKLFQDHLSPSDDKEKTFIKNLHSINWATTEVNQEVAQLTENDQRSIERHKQAAKQAVRQGIGLLNHVQALLSVQDRVTGSVDEKELERRQNFGTQEKEDFLLEKLFELNDGYHHPVKSLLDGNGIYLSSIEEPEGLIQELEDLGFVERLSELGGSRARITVRGRKEVEQKRGPRSQTYENVSEDGEELKRRIDEVLERVKKLETGQQIIYDDLDAEMQKMKERVEQLDKTDWAQLLKAKLIDLALGSVITAEMANEIFQAITDLPLALPMG